MIAQEIAKLLSEIVELASPIPRKLKNFPDKAVIEDVNAQLQALFSKGFLTNTAYSHLTQYPRYLRGIVWRLDKWPDDRQKDAEKMRDVNRFITMYQRAIRSRKGVEDDRLEEFRWMIEELRVSLFAQKLRTPMPVSVKRLDKIWSSMQY